MLAGAAELGLARGKLTSPYWRLCSSLGLVVSGAAFLLHEQNPWFFQRSSFLHHFLGWVLVAGAVFPLARELRPRWAIANAGFALVFMVAAVALYADRDLAPVFGHLSPLAGTPHR
jgi:peptidoglycan/LPS O-acetylase OafA/YrhL